MFQIVYKSQSQNAFSQISLISKQLSNLKQHIFKLVHLAITKFKKLNTVSTFILYNLIFKQCKCYHKISYFGGNWRKKIKQILLNKKKICLPSISRSLKV